MICKRIGRRSIRRNVQTRYLLRRQPTEFRVKRTYSRPFAVSQCSYVGAADHDSGRIPLAEGIHLLPAAAGIKSYSEPTSGFRFVQLGVGMMSSSQDLKFQPDARAFALVQRRSTKYSRRVRPTEI